MANEHESGLQSAFDRAADKPDWQGVVHSEGRFIEGAELNEAQTIARNRHERVARLVASDGNRVDGAAAVVQSELGNVILTAGRLYVAGDVLPVAQTVLSGVSMTGRIEIGVRLTKTWLTSEDDPSLLGIAPGALSEGEPGAAREVVAIAWAVSDDDGEGTFVPVYVLQDGTILDQTPPPSLDGINQSIAIYDRDAHGHYIVSGCRVTALGATAGAQVFSIEEGVANINGFKRSRFAALRHAEPEEWDTETIAGEARTWPAGAGAKVFVVNKAPIDSVLSVLVTKEVTENVTRGLVAAGSDVLANNSVTEILEVKQGGTTYVETTSWVRSGDQVDWAPGGPEPATSSSYTVKYRYLALVAPDAVTDTSITLSGGVAGTTVILSYKWKLPRIDLLCLNSAGESVYVKGVSARSNPFPALPPNDLLPLAEISNSWIGKPSVDNNGVRSITFAQQWRVHRRVQAHERLLELERIKSEIDAREPVAKLGMFVDPFVNDFYRDAGEAQTASVGGGVLELAIEPTFYEGSITAPVTLDWTEEIIIGQERSTSCMKINPYQNFEPLPAGLALTPAADFWSVQQTVWASPVTVEFNRGVRRNNGPLVVSSEAVETVSETEQQAEFLRQIAVSFKLTGMGAGEILNTLTFDGVDVKPAGVITANGAGEIEDDFVIPANITAGVKVVSAEGAGGSKATAFFVGQGIIEIDVMRRVTTIERWTRPPTTTTSGGSDPLAQTFTPPEARMIVGFDVKLCAVGNAANHLFVQQVTVENGIPTGDVVAETLVSMIGATAGEWKSPRFNLPVVTLPDREGAVIVGTDDGDHALSVARLSDFDAESQSYIGAQPYTTGVLLSSSNKMTWTPHQNEDLTFRAVAAKFGPLTKTVPLGNFDLVNASDLQVRASVELPSSDCRVVFEIVRADNSVIRLLPGQVLQLTEYITETVQLRAVLTGSEKLSPILYAPVWLIAGEIATEGTYITRAFKLGAGVDLTAYFKAALPAGSTAVIEYDKADDNWLTLTLASTELLSAPAWVERKHAVAGITGVQGRLKVTITGGPAARPRLGDLGAAIT